MIPLNIPSSNLAAVQGLAPVSLWQHFAALSSLPRASKQETAVLEYIQGVADAKGLTWTQDNVGNMAVFVPGHPETHSNVAPVIIQGHVDMVTEKNIDTEHDFSVDPILLAQTDDGDWLTAQGTTLGADNGIGVAAALALLDEDNARPRPPLELLFTVDEETGLTGATQLDVDTLGLKGRTLLNLDTEEWGALYVGCAGGGESNIALDVERNGDFIVTSAAEASLVELRVDGALGGHSGINIHEGRANAVLLCAAAVEAALQDRTASVSLVSLDGGDKHNAIPREAKALLWTNNLTSTRENVAQSLAAAKAEYGSLETKLDMRLTEMRIPSSTEEVAIPLQDCSARRLITLLIALPHGPLKYSHVLSDLVETSNNVASVSLSAGDSHATVLCSTRSSVAPALEAARGKIAAVASLAGARIAMSPAYPGWQPNFQSSLLQIAQRLLRERLGRDPGVKAIHAGLECGLLMEKLGTEDVDALSLGPTITGAHSPDESVRIDTVAPFYQLVRDILCELAELPSTTPPVDNGHARRPSPMTRPATALKASNIDGEKEESQRYREEAKKLREEIRQMESRLDPLRKRASFQPPPEEQLEPFDAEMTLRGKRVLVAGANGRLGSMVCRYLLRNHPQTEVVACVHYIGENSPTSRGYGRLSYEVGAEDGIGNLGPAWSEERDATFTYDPDVMRNFNLQNLRLVECEFLDPVQCETVVEGCDAVVWCATDFNGNLPRAVSGLNVAFLFRAVARPDKGRVEVEGLQNMVSALRKAQLERKRLDQMSPISKRGKGGDPINFVLVSTDAKAFQNTETPFGSFYGIKQRAEELLKQDFPSVTNTVLRLGRFDDNFVPEDLPINLTDIDDDTEGKQRLINRRDAARAVVDALTNKELTGKIVNVWTKQR